MSKVIKTETLPYDFEQAKIILDKAYVTYKTFANNRTLSEIAFQWKAKVTYDLQPNGDSTAVTVTGKNFSAGPVQRNAVEKEVNSFMTALHDAINEFKKDTRTNSQSTADELLKYKELLDQGVLTQEEFDNQKSKLLGSN